MASNLPDWASAPQASPAELPDWAAAPAAPVALPDWASTPSAVSGSAAEASPGVAATSVLPREPAPPGAPAFDATAFNPQPANVPMQRALRVTGERIRPLESGESFGTLKPYEPKSMQEGVRNKAADFLSLLGMEPYRANDLASRLIGGGGQSPTSGLGAADFTPLGAAFGVDRGVSNVKEGVRDIGEGDYKGGAGNIALGVGEAALNALPLAGSLGKALGGAKRVLSASEAAPAAISEAAPILPAAKAEARMVGSMATAPEQRIAAEAAPSEPFFSEITGGMEGRNPNLTKGQAAAADMPAVEKLASAIVYGDPVADASRYAGEKAITADTVKGAAQRARLLTRDILAPGSMGPDATRAMGVIRETSGLAERATAETTQVMEAYAQRASKMTPAEQMSFWGYVEGRSKGTALFDKTLQPLADDFRTAMKGVQKDLEALDPQAKRAFIEDYAQHVWKDPKKAQAVFSGGKLGSGAFNKERSIPTIADGIAKGLEPATLNPVENALNYVSNARRWIATNEALQAGRATGDVKFFAPGRAPEGWVKIDERAQRFLGGMPEAGAYYAPAGWATIFNNYASRGWSAAGPNAKAVFDGLRDTNATLTSLSLGLSAFHASVMVKEGVASRFAQAFGEAAAGKLGKSAKSLAGSFAAPFNPLVPERLGGGLGRRIMDEYKGVGNNPKEFKEIVDLMSRANMRVTPTERFMRDNAVRASAKGSYWDAFKHGTLKSELAQDVEKMKGSPVMGSAKVFINNVGRIADTVSAPLFQKYIPQLKNQVAFEKIQSWVELNPTATQAEKVAAARKIVDSIDNRLGEMNHDNIFWNKQLKETAQIALLSYSWNFGSLREIAGGLADGVRQVAKGAPKLASGEKAKAFNTRFEFVVGMVAAYGTMNAAYQYLKTGKAPESAHDVIAPRTGGTIPATKYEPQKEERAMLAGYQKELYSFAESVHDAATGQGLSGFAKEAGNKLSPVMRIPGALSGKDWRGLPQYPPEEGALGQAKGVGKNLAALATPISVTQQIEGVPVGSNIGRAERFMGFNPAKRYVQDPEAAGRLRRALDDKAYLQTLSAERNKAEKMGDMEKVRKLEAEIKQRRNKGRTELIKARQRAKGGGEE